MKLKDHQQQKFAKYDLVSLSYFEGQVNCYYVKHCIFWQKTCSSIKKLFFKHSLWLVRWFLIYIESKIVNQLDRFEAFICKVNGKYMNSYQNRSSRLDLQGKMNQFCISTTW